jgi:hypothetical protein
MRVLDSDSSFELLFDCKLLLPEVELPEVELPEVELPEVELPEVELSEVELPEVEPPRGGGFTVPSSLQFCCNGNPETTARPACLISNCPIHPSSLSRDIIFNGAV